MKRLILSDKSQLGWLRLDLWTLTLRSYLQIIGSNQTAVFLLIVCKMGKSCANWPNSPLVCPQPYCSTMRDERQILTVRFSLTAAAQSLNTLNSDISRLMHFIALDLKHSQYIKRCRNEAICCPPSGAPPLLLINTHWNYNYQSATHLLDNKRCSWTRPRTSHRPLLSHYIETQEFI